MAGRLVSLPLALNVDGVKNVLSSYPHMEFPVLDQDGVSERVECLIEFDSYKNYLDSNCYVFFTKLKSSCLLDIHFSTCS